MDPIEINENGPYLVCKPGYTAEFVERTLRERGLTGLEVRRVLPEEQYSDLEFLREFSFLTELQLNGIPDQDFDYEFLSELQALQRLAFNVTLLPGVKAKRLDLGALPQLKSLNLTWRDGITGLERLTQLETLRLVEFRGEDLRPISGLTGLSWLFVATSNIRSVSGIEALRGLEALTLGACRRLRDFQGLAALERLRELRIAGCPHFSDLGPLVRLPELRDLRLEDCRKLASVGPVAEMKLQRLGLIATTDIGDGDTRPLAAVPELAYCHRKHYNVRIPTPIADAIAEENRRKILGLSR